MKLMREVRLPHTPQRPKPGTIRKRKRPLIGSVSLLLLCHDGRMLRSQHHTMTTADEAGASGAGMSRAAKKRARKKHKQEKKELPNKEQAPQSVEKTPFVKDVNDDNVKQKKRHQESMNGDSKKKNLESKKARLDPEEEKCDSSFSDDVPQDDSSSAAVAEVTFQEYTQLSPLVISNRMACQERARAALHFLLQPSQVTVDEFYEIYWEKKPLYIRGPPPSANTNFNRITHRQRFDGFLSLESIREKARDMCYGRDLNVTSYQKDKNGVQRRVTLDNELILQYGRKKQQHKNNNTSDGNDAAAAAAAAADDDDDDNLVHVDPNVLFDSYFYQKHCTIRLLCPQKQSETVFTFVSLLENEWGCMVGANAYLTPPAQSQGFAPHYDDIEAFILQLQGQKHWKVYAPLNKKDELPRVSSEDYTDADLENVEPVLDVVLEPGDVLYMPRGWIHQACTLPLNGDKDKKDQHSLHLTVSTMQQWAWADFMEMLLPEAVQSLAASEESTILREGLPRRFVEYMGAIYDSGEETLPDVLKMKHDDDDADDDVLRGLAETKRHLLRENFRAQAKKRISKVVTEAMKMLDSMCDQMGKRFCSDRLPPAWTREEKAATSLGKTHAFSILPTMLCRLARPGIARLVLEDDNNTNMAVLYHCVDNSRVYRETPVSPMEFEMDDAPAIEQLLTTVEPHWICVNDLFHDSLENKVGVAQALYDEGILAIRE